jgi:hypothetical protein
MRWWLWNRGIAGITQEQCGGRGRKRGGHMFGMCLSFKLRWEAVGRGWCISQKGSGADIRENLLWEYPHFPPDFQEKRSKPARLVRLG